MKGMKALLYLFCVFLLTQSFGSGTDDVGEQSEVSNGKGEYWFRVRIRDHMSDAKTWLSEVRTNPSDKDFPGVKVNESSIIENTSRTLLTIRGIEVPPAASDFNSWHRASEREETRFDESMHHVWKLLSASETCIIKDPKDIGGIVEGEVFVVIGGVRLNLGDSLVHDGFAMRKTKKGIDWRQRIPRERD